jgi:PTH1 family peptidyl-tRNA hydrolase
VTRIVVGLGNPGPEYEWTRHNVGFHVLDHLALHEGLLFQTARELEQTMGVAAGGDAGQVGVRSYGGPRKFRFARVFDPDALLIKPETFMNRSGDVVGALARWAEVPPEELLVVHDDLDLELGRLRLRAHGGAGGHNGMRSIIDGLGSDRFPRLRVGIGRPRTDAARHVLATFDERERVEIEISIAEASEALLDWLDSGDIERCMTRFHSRWNQNAG